MPLRAIGIAAASIASIWLAPDAAAAASPPADMQALADTDLRVAGIAYRLATAGRDYCPQTLTGLPGWVIGDAAQYAPALRPAASRLFGLGRGETVVGVVAGGAADAAGVRAGDVIVAIDGRALPNVTPGPDAPATYKPLGAALDALSTAFSAGPVRLDLERAGRPIPITVAGAPGCRSIFQLEPSSGFHASANGKLVSISTAMVNFARSDDELAFVLGHELSHNILGHRARLEEAKVSFGLFRALGKNPARIRRTEMEADYLGLYLVARAGYDLDAAPAFWIRFAKAHGDGLLSDHTHMGDRDRIGYIESGVAEIRRRQSAGQPLTPDLTGLPAQR